VLIFQPTQESLPKYVIFNSVDIYNAFTTFITIDNVSRKYENLEKQVSLKLWHHLQVKSKLFTRCHEKHNNNDAVLFLFSNRLIIYLITDLTGQWLAHVQAERELKCWGAALQYRPIIYAAKMQ